jgi:uncharacterized YccA/Bax inhibitor family protein
VKSSNPVLTKLGPNDGRRSGNWPGTNQDAGIASGYGSGYGPYGQQSMISARDPERTMTLDDVVTRTLGLVALVVIAAGLSWVFVRSGPIVTLAWIGSTIAGLVLVFVISFRRITNPPLIMLYAALQGILMGLVSRAFEDVYPGIVIQAVVGTLAVFFGMAAAYKFRVLRATPRFRRWVIGVLFGVVGLSLVNLLLSAFGHNPGLVYYRPGDHGSALAIVFSLVAIGVGALTFILDFDQVEQGVRYGLPERFAWYCAFGLIVGLIFLYWQILRLLGYLRN